MPALSLLSAVQPAVARTRRGDQYPLFVMAAAGMLLLAPRLLLVLHHGVLELAGAYAPTPNLEAWPYVPRMLPLGVLIALVTFRLDLRTRLTVLVASLGPIAWARGSVDLRSVVPLALFGLAAWALIRLRLPRVWVGWLVTALACLSLAATARWWSDTPAVRLLASLPVLVPLLWYSVYEHGRRTTLQLRRFALYLSSRLFSAPVMTYDDLFRPLDGAQLTAVRWEGVRTICIALCASIAAHLAARAGAMVPRDTLVGLPLLGLSYVEYVGFYCGFVVRFNTVIGVLRLFGVPIRSNFRYWLLARTPNEHWQRWNVLAREWYLTFIFYPLMRIRRSVLLAVMAAMLASAVLHVVPLAVVDGFSASHAFASAMYAVVNGLAICAVIAVPRKYPAVMARLRLGSSPAWSVVGVIVTSAFYAVLHGLRVWSGSWAEMAHYVTRLAGSLPV
jgi:hypothetical protein